MTLAYGYDKAKLDYLNYIPLESHTFLYYNEIYSLLITFKVTYHQNINIPCTITVIETVSPVNRHERGSILAFIAHACINGFFFCLFLKK